MREDALSLIDLVHPQTLERRRGIRDIRPWRQAFVPSPRERQARNERLQSVVVAADGDRLVDDCPALLRFRIHPLGHDGSTDECNAHGVATDDGSDATSGSERGQSDSDDRVSA